jgi:hypothetical protein
MRNWNFPEIMDIFEFGIGFSGFPAGKRCEFDLLQKKSENVQKMQKKLITKNSTFAGARTQKLHSVKTSTQIHFLR